MTEIWKNARLHVSCRRSSQHVKKVNKTTHRILGYFCQTCVDYCLARDILRVSLHSLIALKPHPSTHPYYSFANRWKTKHVSNNLLSNNQLTQMTTK